VAFGWAKSYNLVIAGLVPAIQEHETTGKIPLKRSGL
jgi:hypothetical protein